jgi:uncharacterized membrane protein
MILSWCLLVGTMAVLRHLAFNSTAYDLGIFDQVIWNTSQGHWFQNSIMRDSPHHFGHHFSPILLLFVPLYWIRPDPTTLIAAQTLLVGLAGLPVLWMARQLLGSPRWGLVLLGAYLLHPATAYICLFDFHEVAVAVPLLCLALYAILLGRYRLFLATLLPLLLVKEDLGLVCAAIGVYLALAHRRWLLGGPVAFLGILWTVLLVSGVIPAFHPSGEYHFTYLYSEFGASPFEILASLISQPGAMWQRLATPDRLEYLLQIILPLGGLPVLGAPMLLMALPGLLLQLLSNHLPAPLIKFQYSATVLPVVLAATALGARQICHIAAQYRQGLSGFLMVWLVVCSILGAYLYGPLPGARRFDASQHAQIPRFDTLRRMLAQIPPEASVVAQCNIVPHLSRRPAVYQFYYRDTNPPPDFYLLDTLWRGCAFWFAENDVVLGQVLADPNYAVIDEGDDYILLRPEPWTIGRPVSAVLESHLEIVGVSLPKTGVVAGQDLTVDIYYRTLQQPDADYSLLLYLRGPDGQRWGQRHGYPVGGHWLTSRWPTGQLLRGHKQVPVAAGAPPGQYEIVAEFYELPAMHRLRATGLAPHIGKESLVLGEVAVVESGYR